MDLEKLKKEIEELNTTITKKTKEYWILKEKYQKGTTLQIKIQLNKLKTEIAGLTIERDKKTFQYHNYFNPFKCIFILIIMFGLFNAAPPSTNFEVIQSDLAMSEIFSNYSDYIRAGFEQRVGVYIEPIYGREIKEVTFKIDGCGIDGMTSIGIEAEETNVFYTLSTINPTIKLNDKSYGSSERCLLNVEVIVKDDAYYNWEKKFGIYIGRSISGCEYTNDCKVASLSNARGYYYYDNLEITGAMSVIQSPGSSESYVYLETKDTLKIGSITSSSRNGVCGTDEDGQEGDEVYLVGRHVIVSNGVTLNGGAGAKCSGDRGGYGGSGGYLEIMAIESIVLNGNINMNGGNGGDGYTRDERWGQDGGNGGRGGSIYIGKLNNVLSSPSFTRTSGTINLNGGDGGKGDDGNLASSSQSYSDGGYGGDGGDTERFDFSGLSKVVIGGTINMNAGNGGNGGRGRCKESNPYIGGSSGGGDGGDINRLFLYSAQSKEILLTATINIKGGNGGNSGTPCDAGRSYGGDAGRLSGAGISLNCDFIFSGGRYTITMGNGGSYSTGGTGSRANGCRGGFYRPSDSKRPYFDSRGLLDVRRNIKGVRGTSGDTSSNCPYMEAYWDIEYTDGLLAPTNNFNNFLPNRQYAPYSFSVIYIGDEIDINVSDITLRKTNFDDAVDYVVSNNTQLILFYLYDTSDNFISQLFTNSTLSGIPEGNYYIRMYNCRTNNNHGCVSVNSNVFTISNVPTNIIGYTFPEALINLTSSTFEALCLYYTNESNITRANVYVDVDGERTKMERENGEYVFTNYKYYSSSNIKDINCTGHKRDFESITVKIGELKFNDIVIDMPYGYPRTICMFPTQKNVVPLYQTSTRPLIRIVNLGGESLNISASFNYPLPESIKHGLITNSFKYSWEGYVILNTTPQRIATNLNPFDGTQNVSSYSIPIWLLTNCTNANPGEDIIYYSGEYVFVKEEIE